jgi:hypothetical protein
VARQKTKYKTLLTNPLCVVFRNGYPFVSYIVLPFHHKFDALIFSLAVPRRGHDKGPLSDFGYPGHALIQTNINSLS